MKIKNFLIFVLIFTLNTFLFCQEYKVNQVVYEINGSTNQKYLEAYLDIDNDFIFSSKDDFDSFAEKIKTRLNDLRQLESYEVSSDFVNEDSSDLILVNLTIKTTDTKNFIALPYPKYDSNEGLVFKIKLRDSNLFGTLTELNSELVYAYTEKFDHKLGLQFDFNIPIYFNFLGTNLFSNFETGYFINEQKFLFDTESGFEFFYPIINPIIKFGLNQIADYNTNKTLFNEWFLSENLFIKFPFYFNDFTFSLILSSQWDVLPKYEYANKFGFNLYKNSVNWISNFRKGFILDSSNYINLFYNDFSYKFSLETIFVYYNNFSFFATNFRVYGFYNPENNFVAKFIRGITDTSLNSNLGFICNFDFPISVIKINKNKWYDLELQISPFMDIGYANNFVISGGLEFLVYPRITRSLQLRVCSGISKNDLELFVGIGLFY